INLTKSGYGNGSPKFAMDGEMIYYSTDRYGLRAHGGWGSEGDIEAVFLTEEAYQKFKLSEEDFELWKEEQKDSKKKDKEEDGKEKDKEEKEEGVDPIKLELEGIED